MQRANGHKQTELRQAKHSFCLTNMSVVALAGWALGASALLWLCIWAVL